MKQYDANPLLGAKHWGPAGGVLLARYHDTPVGPYNELILTSGLHRLGSHVGFHISQIFVDSKSSLLGGRLNWGAPKELAVFDWQTQDQTIQVKVSLQGKSQPFLTASFNQSNLHVPAWSAVVPPPLKTILQAGKQLPGDAAASEFLSTGVNATGSLHALSAIKLQTDRSVVPDAKDLAIWRTGISLTGFRGRFGEPVTFTA